MNSQKCYFGAANGYSGFRSNFNGIFSPQLLDKLFIIKGGPGTGKSSLMRSIDERYRDKYDTTVILCSSDPDSYDGILIQKEEIIIGIVDGTPPHVMEPRYPGAVEEIINLGDSFDYDILCERRKEILSLSDKKKTEYKRAYNALAIAGDIYSYTASNFANFHKYNSAELLISQFLDCETDPGDSYEKSLYLVGAFSKNGYKRMYNFNYRKKQIPIKGDGISEYIFLSEIAKKLAYNRIAFKFFPSAFSSDIPDIIETHNAVYFISDEYENALDTRSLISENEEYFRLCTSYQNLIESSRQALVKASEYHFSLEGIYSNAMRFGENKKKYDRIVKTIDAILDK